MLTPGERLFRKGLYIVIGLLLATVAVLVAIEQVRGPPPQPASSTRR